MINLVECPLCEFPSCCDPEWAEDYKAQQEKYKKMLKALRACKNAIDEACRIGDSEWNVYAGFKTAKTLIDEVLERCHDIQGRIAKVPEYEDELQFQTQMAKDTDEAAEYYRRLLLEARAERDMVIRHARTLAKHARVPDVIVGEEFPDLEHVAVLIEKYS